MPLIILIVILLWWAYIAYQMDIKWQNQIKLREREELMRKDLTQESNNMQNNVIPTILTKKESQAKWVRNSILTFLWIGILVIFIRYVLLFILVSILATM